MGLKALGFGGILSVNCQVLTVRQFTDRDIDTDTAVNCYDILKNIVTFVRFTAVGSGDIPLNVATFKWWF